MVPKDYIKCPPVLGLSLNLDFIGLELATMPSNSHISTCTSVLG